MDDGVKFARPAKTGLALGIALLAFGALFMAANFAGGLFIKRLACSIEEAGGDGTPLSSIAQSPDFLDGRCRVERLEISFDYFVKNIERGGGNIFQTSTGHQGLRAVVDMNNVNAVFPDLNNARCFSGVTLKRFKEREWLRFRLVVRDGKLRAWQSRIADGKELDPLGCDAATLDVGPDFRIKLDKLRFGADFPLHGGFAGEVKNFSLRFSGVTGFDLKPLLLPLGPAFVFLGLVALLSNGRKEEEPLAGRRALTSFEIEIAALIAAPLTVLTMLLAQGQTPIPSVEETAKMASLLLFPDTLNPEPDERAMYLACCLAAPFALLAAGAASGLWRCPLFSWSGFLARKLDERSANRALRVATTAIALGVAAFAWGCLCINAQSLHCDFFGMQIKDELCMTIAGALAAAGLTGALLWRGGGVKALKKLSLFAALALPLAGALLFKLYLPGDMDAFSLHHFNPLAYATSQSAAGNFSPHQYGLYPELLAPLFKLAGMSAFKLSLFFSLLYAAALAALFLTARRLLKSSLLALGFMLTTLLSTGAWGWLNRQGFDAYYQLFPLRFVGPVVMLCCLMATMRAKRKEAALAVSGALGGLFIAWNMESGIPAFVAYCACVGADLFGQPFARTCKNLALASLPAVAVFALASLLPALNGGGEFNAFGTFSTQKLFYINGYMAIRMPPPPAPWLALALVYFFALAFSLRQVAAGKVSPAGKSALFLAILGCGLFAYYQGRSHIYNLPGVIWPGLLLLFLLGDRALDAVKAKSMPSAFGLLALPAFLLSALALADFGSESLTLKARTARVAQEIRDFKKPTRLQEHVEFMKKQARGRTDVAIFGLDQGIYYAETGFKAPLASGCQIECFAKEDWRRILFEIGKAETPLFISKNDDPDDPQRLFAWTLENYREAARTPDGKIVFYEPKRAQEQASPSPASSPRR